MPHHYIHHASTLLGEYLYIFVFLANVLESTPIVGTFTPGMVLLIFFGFTAFLNKLNLAYIILIGFFGAVIGDIIGYMIGKYAGGWMIKNKKLLKESHVETGRAFFSKHGGKSILIGRFIGIIRPIVPVIAGSIGMSFRRFIFWNMLGAFLWVTAYTSIGYFFGYHTPIIERVVTRIGWISVLLAIPLVAYAYKKYKNLIIVKGHEKQQ